MKMNEQINSDKNIAMGCLGCYAEGRLVFKWISYEQLVDEDGVIHTGRGLCKLAGCTHEHHDEWHIQDYDGINLGENPDIQHLYSLFEYLDGDEDRDAILLACKNNYSTTQEMSDNVEHVKENLFYACEYEFELKDYFMNEAYENGIATDDNPLVSYVDWEHYARDQMYNYTQIKTDQGIYLWGSWC